MDSNSSDYAKIAAYIDRNPAAVLGTIGQDGPHGTVIYVISASHGTLCFVTKNQTKKYQNILANPSVCLTFFNDKESTTLQVAGKAYVADNSQGLKEIVIDKVTKAHAIMSDWLPPVIKIQNGDYAVIGIDVTYARLSDYGGADSNGPRIIEVT